MELRTFMRFHLLKTLLVLVVVQLIILAMVQNYDHRPVALPDNVSVIEGRTVKISPLFNDLDKDIPDVLSVIHVSTPLHGSVKKRGNLVFYTPNTNFIGADSLTYTISDGHKESKACYISIHVNKNLPPVAVRDIAEVYSGDKVMIDVLGNDYDREKDSVYLKRYLQPVHGHLIQTGTQFVYTSSTVSVDKDSFLYVVGDGHNNLDSSYAVINIKSKSDPCYPWLSVDAGNAAIAGYSTSLGKSFVVEGSGTDIWNSSDGFRFVYRYAHGDCQMITKIDSLEGTNAWAKAGIMVRESLSGGSRCSYVFVSKRNGASYHYRNIPNDPMIGASMTIDGIKAPYWVKLSRKGNLFCFYISADGIKWVRIDQVEVPMSQKVYIGFAVTSHNNAELGKAVFSKYSLAGHFTTL
jgi:hypothetical protein